MPLILAGMGDHVDQAASRSTEFRIDRRTGDAKLLDHLKADRDAISAGGFVAPGSADPVASSTMPCKLPVVEDWPHSNAQPSAVRRNRTRKPSKYLAQRSERICVDHFERTHAVVGMSSGQAFLPSRLNRSQ